MPKTLHLLLLLFVITPYIAKAQGCEALIKDARTLAKNLKFDDAIKKVEAAKGCAAQADIDKLYSEIFAGLKKQTIDANKAKERAEKAENIALSEKEKATASEKKAIAEKLRADSIAETNHRQALHAYANDLAYKSTIALQHGDRASAFRLAEFAQNFVESENEYVRKALFESLYYDNNPNFQPLPWASNLGGYISSVNCLDFSQDGEYLVAGSEDGSAKIWGLRSGKVVFEVQSDSQPVNCVSISPDSRRLAIGFDHDGDVDIYDLLKGESFLKLKGHSFPVTSIDFSLNGTQIVTGSWDNTAKVWNLGAIKDKRNAIECSYTLIGHTEPVISVAFSPDGKRLATGSYDNTVKIWNLDTLSQANHEQASLLTLKGHLRGVTSVAFSSDGKRLATGSHDNTAKIWDMESGKSIFTFEGHSNWVNSVAFSSDNKYLTTCSEDKTIKMWNLETLSSLSQRYNNCQTIQGHSDKITCIKFSPDGKRFATSSGDKTIKIWEFCPQGWFSNTEKGKRVAYLIPNQISNYGLEVLLDLRPENENILIESKNIWQIAAFADLYTDKIAKSLPKKADYERAKRLYKACLVSDVDKPYFEKKIANLEQLWKEKTK